MRSRPELGVIIATRCFAEAVAFASLAAMLHVLATGTRPLALLPTTVALFGVGLLLATIQREVGERRGTTVLVAGIGLGIVWGLSLPSRDPDFLAVLSRMVGFGLLALAFLWRNLSIARGAIRWSNARDGLVLAAGTLVALVFWPEPVDREPVPALAMLVLTLSGLGMSLARSAEELSLARGTKGGVGIGSASGVSFIVGLAAVVTALLIPTVQGLLSRLGDALAPYIERVLYTLLLPLGYLAAAVVEFIIELYRRLPIRPRLDDVQAQPPQVDEEVLAQIERNRPFVFGAVELIIVAIAVLVGLLLFERMLREKRRQLPESVELERAGASGFGIREMLSRLFGPRRRRRRAPRDDGSASAALRILYWRFLGLAERSGAGWREPQETPAEHLLRIKGSDTRWSAGEPIVRAFEDLRYGDEAPDPPRLALARDALAALEAARRAS